jgi:Subtilase family
MTKLAIALAAVVAFALPGVAAAGRYAVGVAPGTSLSGLTSSLETERGAWVTSGDPELRALFVDAPRAEVFAGLSGVTYVERLDGAPRRLAFTPNDPLLPRQWYLAQIRAFDAWPQLPSFQTGPLVAVLDSGVDAKHPELAGQIAGSKSFIGASAFEDKRGHGTFVAGEIAAATANNVGIAGVGFPAELLIAKVARADGTIPLEAEARAIRWAVDNRARVINLSLAGVRDPFRAGQDTYSPLEASAVAYARRHGTLIVAAVGNGDQAPRMPWSYAGYPAALPHVVGVSAIARDGSVPAFSNRDPIYNDVTAPGEDIYSTIPRAFGAARPGCGNPGYSDCGPAEYRHADGTSFSAPQVAGAAAVVLAVKPNLTPDQLAYVLERSAREIDNAGGCKACPTGRDRFTGWGRVDVAAAVQQVLSGPFPRADRYETNDDAGTRAWPLRWKTGTLTATLDYWDDQIDVYRVRLRKGQRLTASVRGPAGEDVDLLLWKPATKTVVGFRPRRGLAARSAGPGSRERIDAYRAPASGSYYLEAKLVSPGAGAYSLSLSKR